MSIRPYNYQNVMETLYIEKQKRKPYKIWQLKGHDSKENMLVLRFDVENSPEIALKFAEDLAKIDFPATFYFHSRCEVFVPAIMQKIEALNHEVGLHYECLDRCKGNFPAARKLLIEEINLFRKAGIDIKTICSHSELFLPKNGYLLNNELVMEYPEVINECNLVGDANFLTRKLNMLHARDTFVGIFKMNKIIETASLDRGVHILLHSHRWRNHLHQSLNYCYKDLKQAWYNIKNGTREYNLYEMN